MKIGIPKEIKNHEYRVGMTPSSVREAVSHGHSVMIETRAGEGIGAIDDEYRAVGATIIDRAEDIFSSADLIVKVKEPQAVERAMLRSPSSWRRDREWLRATRPSCRPRVGTMNRN